MTMVLVLLLGLLGCHGLPEVEISRGKRLYKGYQAQAKRATKGRQKHGPYVDVCWEVCVKIA